MSLSTSKVSAARRPALEGQRSESGREHSRRDRSVATMLPTCDRSYRLHIIHRDASDDHRRLTDAPMTGPKVCPGIAAR